MLKSSKSWSFISNNKWTLLRLLVYYRIMIMMPVKISLLTSTKKTITHIEHNYEMENSVNFKLPAQLKNKYPNLPENNSTCRCDGSWVHLLSERHVTHWVVNTEKKSNVWYIRIALEKSKGRKLKSCGSMGQYWKGTTSVE